MVSYGVEFYAPTCEDIFMHMDWGIVFRYQFQVGMCWNITVIVVSKGLAAKVGG